MGKLDLEPGTRAGGYVVEERIAAGGFGTVYRAVDDAGQRVALKVMHLDLVSSPEAVARFGREVRAVRRLAHPSVAAIYDVGELDDKQPYFAMQLLVGVSLRDRIRQQGRLSPDEALAVIETVGDALAAAHAQGIVHRDVKASNVFVADDGTVMLLDFGIAKLIDDTGERITSSRQIVGSPPCMAPEQILHRSVDERADIYALGVLTYEMLTGGLPFASPNVAAIYDMHLHTAPPRPSRRAPVGAGFDELVARAMAKEPADRYAAVADVVAAFRDAVTELTDAETKSENNALASTCMAVHVAIEIDSGAAAELPEHVLDAVESLLPRAAALCAPFGFRVAMESGDALLLVVALPARSSDAARLRAGVIDAALELERAATIEFGAAPVRAAVFVHVGAEQQLVRPAEWLPDATPGGVFATMDALAALDRDTEAGPEGFRRVAAPELGTSETPPTR